MSDEEFDKLCDRVEPNFRTGANKLDQFFREEFRGSTGMWIHKHPNKAGLKRILRRVFKVEC